MGLFTAKKFKQRDATDCGPTCLGFVAHHYRLRLPIARIRQIAGTDQVGTTALGLLEAAEKLGFQTKGVKGAPESLAKVPKPSIVHLKVKNGHFHFVVLTKVSERWVEVMDPVDGRFHRHSHDEFQQQWTGVLVLLVPGERFRVGGEVTSVGWRFWGLIRPHGWGLVQALLGAVAGTVLALAGSIYVGRIVDSVIPDGNQPLLNLMALGMVVIMGFRIVLGIFQSLITLRVGQALNATLLLGYYRHLLSLPQSFFDTMRVGEMLSRMGDAIRIQAFINSGVLNLILSTLIALFSLGAMFFFAWPLAVLSIVLVAVNAVLYWVVNRINRYFERRLMESGADLEAQLVESLNSATVLRQFRLEWLANIRTENRLVKLLKLSWGSSIAGVWTGSIGAIFSQLYTIGLLWVGASLALEAQLTPGKLMTCYALASQLLGPIGALLGMNQMIQSALIAADRLFEIMDLEAESNEGKIELTPDRLGDIRMDNVTFKHPGRTEVLQDVSLTIPAGRITALVGESGSGKSTLLALLQRLYPLEKGKVYVGETDLNFVTAVSWRQLIAPVPQKVDLLAGTIAENIGPGEFPPDLPTVECLCRELGLSEFIDSLPDGYHTVLTENGTNLSGGQRQRIAIARALYTKPEVLLLDEPEASLDTESERRLMTVLQRLRREGKTIVMAGHRGQLLDLADRTYRLNRGQIVAEGA